jgi:hypothetical protein
MTRSPHGISRALLSFCLLVPAPLLASAARKSDSGADRYVKPHVQAGQTLSDVTYRVIAIHGDGMDDSVIQFPATGTYTFLPDTSPDGIRWSITARMDGRMAIDHAEGEYRDNDTTLCFQGKCNVMTDAGAPFYNPNFWGDPPRRLTPGDSWSVSLSQPWELGPAGRQTVTVLAVDAKNGIVILKRKGEAAGSYAGAPLKMTIKKDGKPYQVDVKYGLAQWSGQAVFQHGVVVSDELLCETALDLSSPELGVIHAVERQYMSVLEHPDPIAG